MFLIDKNHMKRIVFLLILVLQFSFVNSQENELFHAGAKTTIKIQN